MRKRFDFCHRRAQSGCCQIGTVPSGQDRADACSGRQRLREFLHTRHELLKWSALIAFIPGAADFSVRGDQDALCSGAPKVDAQEKVAACLRKINCGNAGFCVTVKKRAALVLVAKKRFWSGAFVQVDGFSTDGIDQVF